jgi:hypothetical protein
MADRPGDHDNGQCSACHNTRNWDDDDGDEGGDGDDDDDDDEGDNDGDHDEGDDDDDDDEDDEYGSLNAATRELYASIQNPLECATCHTHNMVISEMEQSDERSTWLHDLFMQFQKIDPIAIG